MPTVTAAVTRYLGTAVVTVTAPTIEGRPYAYHAEIERVACEALNTDADTLRRNATHATAWRDGKQLHTFAL